MEVFWTVFAGTTVFVLGQIFVKFFIEPIHEFYRHTGEIADLLIYYANVYSNPGLCREEVLRQAHEDFRRHSTQLLARVHVIPLYRLWERLRIVPLRADVVKAGGYLIGISNDLTQRATVAEDNDRRRRGIEKLLRIETGE